MMCTLLFWSFAIAGGIGFDSLDSIDSLIHSIVGGGHNNQKRYAKSIANVVSGLGNCAADTVRVILVIRHALQISPILLV